MKKCSCKTNLSPQKNGKNFIESVTSEKPTQIFLVGNSNAGKSTIFNHLTKSRVHTGNWNGVTVSAFSRLVSHKSKRFLVTDLPGIYGLKPTSQDEKNAVFEIENNPNAIFVNVIDCNTLSKSLHLTLQLKSRGLRVILLPNFTQKANKRGLKIDLNKLGQELGVAVCNLDYKSRNFARDFLDFVSRTPPQQHTQNYTSAIERKRKIDSLLSQCVTGCADSIYAFNRIDKLLTSRIFGVPIFLILMFATFWLTFGAVGKFLSQTAVSVWELCVKVMALPFASLNVPAWLGEFFGEGVLGSVGGIIGFLPQIILLWLCLEFLEQSGYLSRIVWLLEPIFARLGLSGKSAFPLLLGFGCTTLATPTVLAIKSCSVRERTACILPFVSCNAKLPVLLCIASALFPHHTTIAVFLLYVLGVVVALVFALIWQKFRPISTQNEIFEFTPLVIPNFCGLLQKTFLTATRFLRKIWSIVLIFGIIIWLLSHLNFMLQQTEIEDSILAHISKLFTPIFLPLGFSWGSVVALVVGVVAKEMVISTIAVLNGTTALTVSIIDTTAVVHFDTFSGIAFLVFVALYTPCISALTQLRAVLPRKNFIAQILTQFALAYVLSFIIMLIVKTLVFCGAWVLGFVLIFAVLCAILLYFTLKRFVFSKNCTKNCNFCNRS